MTQSEYIIKSNEINNSLKFIKDDMSFTVSFTYYVITIYIISVALVETMSIWIFLHACYTVYLIFYWYKLYVSIKRQRVLRNELKSLLAWSLDNNINK
jgi:hypothetical protein